MWTASNKQTNKQLAPTRYNVSIADQLAATLWSDLRWISDERRDVVLDFVFRRFCDNSRKTLKKKCSKLVQNWYTGARGARETCTTSISPLCLWNSSLDNSYCSVLWKRNRYQWNISGFLFIHRSYGVTVSPFSSLVQVSQNCFWIFQENYNCMK